MAADLMVAHPLDPNGEPVWLFLSVALGWIAYADIHTENWRYASSLYIALQCLINRFMGDTRFTLGVSKKFAKKTRYTCSVATHLHQTDKPANVPEDAARQVVKDGLRTFYQTNYANGPGPVCQNSLASPNLDNLIGTIVPPDRWDMKGYNLISLYAGKVPVSLAFSLLIGFSFRGFQEVHWHFLLLFRTMGTLTSAFWKEASASGANL